MKLLFKIMVYGSRVPNSTMIDADQPSKNKQDLKAYQFNVDSQHLELLLDTTVDSLKAFAEVNKPLYRRWLTASLHPGDQIIWKEKPVTLKYFLLALIKHNVLTVPKNKWEVLLPIFYGKMWREQIERFHHSLDIKMTPFTAKEKLDAIVQEYVHYMS